MNKKTLNLLILLFLNIVISFSQNIEGRITYVASIKNAINYNKKEGIKEINHKRNHVNDIYKKAKDVKVVLVFNNDISEYYVIEKMSLSNRENINLTHIMAGDENKYYTHNSLMGYSNNTLDCYLLGECFLIENNLPKWELKQETKKIQGFLCYKAILKNPKTGKQNIEAWYAPKIPYQYGVKDYYGLPGVILEINRSIFSITATKIELNPIKKIVIEKPSKKIKKLTKKEFKVLTRKVMPGYFKKN